MFDKTQYVIEMTLGSSFFEPVRDTYNIKNTHGNLLGYAKKQRLKLWSKFWFEGTDGTRMGEIRSSKKGYEVYDAQDNLQATIKEKPRSGSKKGFLLGIILLIACPIVVGIGFGMYSTTPTIGSLAMVVVGAVLTVLGVFYVVLTYQRPEWLVEGSEGHQLAEIKEVGKLFAEYQVLTPEGDVIAHIHKRRGLAAFRHSYSIDITHQVLNPRFIISYAILRADMDKAITSAAPTPALII